LNSTSPVASLTNPGLLGLPDSSRLADADLVEAALRFERALNSVLTEFELIERSHGLLIESVLEKSVDPAELVTATIANSNFAVGLLELLKSRVAEHDVLAADSLHLGATSQDVVDTALILLSKRATAEAISSSKQLMQDLLSLAKQHADDVCVARTLSQHAAPSTLGVKLERWGHSLLAAVTELVNCSAKLPLQFGGAVGDLGSLTAAATARGKTNDDVRAVVTGVAKELGLVAPEFSWHANRSALNSLGNAIYNLLAAQAQIANELLLLSRTEVGEAVQLAASGGKSSAMPHKSNPVVLIQIRSNLLQAASLQQLLLSAAVGSEERSSGELQAGWNAWHQLLKLLVASCHQASGIFSQFKFSATAAKANLELLGGAVYSERVKAVAGSAAAKAFLEVVSGSGDLRAALADLPDSQRDAILSTQSTYTLARIAELEKRIRELG
jgi:3-carboxy-cis,cis-muconate cycloisomerase